MSTILIIVLIWIGFSIFMEFKKRSTVRELYQLGIKAKTIQKTINTHFKELHNKIDNQILNSQQKPLKKSPALLEKEFFKIFRELNYTNKQPIYISYEQFKEAKMKFYELCDSNPVETERDLNYPFIPIVNNLYAIEKSEFTPFEIQSHKRFCSSYM